METDDSGFGLVDVIVAMFLLALISLAVLPGLINGLKLSQSNAIISTQTQLVNQQLEDARSHSTCSSIAPITEDVYPTQHVTLHVVRTVGACPVSGYPQAIPVTVTATRSDTGAPVTSNTNVFVTGP